MTLPFSDHPKRRRKRGKRGGVKHRLKHQRVQHDAIVLPIRPATPPVAVASLRARLHSLSTRKAG